MRYFWLFIAWTPGLKVHIDDLMSEKFEQKTEINQHGESITLIEESLLYKTAGLVFPPTTM
jgi:hypothetical protein